MHSPGINGEGELRRQPANTGSTGKMAVKMESVCMCSDVVGWATGRASVLYKAECWFLVVRI